MSLTGHEEKNKENYDKPVLRTIELAAEEVLGLGCKLSTGGTAFGSPINCTFNSCAGAGS
jgi:hypothetical protein